jgi:hypothetical protein
MMAIPWWRDSRVKLGILENILEMDQKLEGEFIKKHYTRKIFHRNILLDTLFYFASLKITLRHFACCSGTFLDTSETLSNVGTLVEIFM